jgi:hypothetical protein
MVVGKAIKIQDSQPRSSLIQAKDTLRHHDGSSDEGSELDLYQLSEIDGVSSRLNQFTAGKTQGNSPNKHLTSISKVGASLLDSQIQMDLTASYQSLDEDRKSENLRPQVQPFVTGSEK